MFSKISRQVSIKTKLAKCVPPEPPPVDVDALKEEWEKDLKAKSDELESTKKKLDQEKDSKQRLQKQAAAAASSLQDVTARLAKSREAEDKLRVENKKKQDQVEKLERNISHMEDRIRNLEIRASEVEKAELTLESTRRHLESSQHECRSKEGEILRLQDKYDKTCLDLEEANKQIADMDKKIDDLKHQVRFELMKNENIERGLETIPHLKDDIQERDQKIRQLEKDMDEKTALLTAARKAVRDYRDRIRDLERGEAEGLSLREDLEVARQEVTSLKHLVTGKDALVLRKTQALEQAKVVIESLPRSADEKDKLRKIQALLTRLGSMQNDTATNGYHNGIESNAARSKPPLTPRGRNAQDGGRGLSVDTSPFQARDSDYSLLERCLQENAPPQDSSYPPPSTSSAFPPPSSSSTSSHTAVVAPVRRSASFQGHSHSYSAHARVPRVKPSSGAHPTRSISQGGGRVEGGGSTYSSTSSINLLSTRGGSQGSLVGDGNVYRPETRPASRFPPSLDYPLGDSESDEGAFKNSRGSAQWATKAGVRKKDVRGKNSAPGPARLARPYSAAVTGRGPGALDAEGDLAMRYGSQSEDEANSDDDDDDDDDEDADGRGGVRDEREVARMQLSARQKDEVLAKAIALGDRVSITVAQRPPRYGRKKPKPITYTGIVKYVGRLDADRYDARVFCGVRLDEPIGEKDGVYKGKRYMFTPINHAKFFKIRDVNSILDVKSGQYVQASRLLLKHFKKSISFHRGKDNLMSGTM